MLLLRDTGSVDTHELLVLVALSLRRVPVLAYVLRSTFRPLLNCRRDTSMQRATPPRRVGAKCTCDWAYREKLSEATPPNNCGLEKSVFFRPRVRLAAASLAKTQVLHCTVLFLKYPNYGTAAAHPRRGSEIRRSHGCVPRPRPTSSQPNNRRQMVALHVPVDAACSQEATRGTRDGCTVLYLIGAATGG